MKSQQWNSDGGFWQTVDVPDSALTMINGEAFPLTQGQAVYVAGPGQVRRASHDDDEAFRVVGLAVEDIAPGQPGLALTEDTLTIPDWTPMTGTATLAAGATYYLGLDGGLTQIPPVDPGAHVILVGLAVDHARLKIEIRHKVRHGGHTAYRQTSTGARRITEDGRLIATT